MRITLLLLKENHIALTINRGNRTIPEWTLTWHGKNIFSESTVQNGGLTSISGSAHIENFSKIESFIAAYEKNGGDRTETWSNDDVPPMYAQDKIYIKSPEHLRKVFDKLTKNKQEITTDNKLKVSTETFENAKAITLDEFKVAYKQQYNSEFFKNPFSGMKRKLEANEVPSIQVVETYAKDHPNSRTAKVLQELKRKF